MTHGLNSTNPAFGVIDKLTATGKIDYIQNDSLKQLLSEWKDEVLDNKENEERHMNLVMNQMRPIQNRMLLMAGLDRTENLREYNFYSLREIQSHADAAIQNPEFINLWIRNLQILTNIDSNGKLLQQHLKAMISMLEIEIKKGK